MRYYKRCQPLRWFGGKQRDSKQKWIAGLLPWSERDVYVEPFGGQMSVLLYRAPVKCEIYNDLDGHVVNWWRALRADQERLAHLIERLPHARQELVWAMEVLDQGDEADRFDRALAFYAACMFSQNPTAPGSFLLRLHPSGGPGTWTTDRVATLAERIKDVQIENVDALRLLERTAERPHCVVYCDPPYAQAVSGGQDYRVDVDYELLKERLLAQAGKVAITGYGDEWDSLGWQRYELETSMPSLAGWGIGVYPRTEVLWTNYDPEREGCAFGEAAAIMDGHADRQLDRRVRSLSEAY